MEQQRESTSKRNSPKIKASKSGKIRKLWDFRKYLKGYRTYKSKETLLSSDLDISKKKEVVGLCNNGFDYEDFRHIKCDLPQACGSSNFLNTDITDPMCCDRILVIGLANSEESLPWDVTQTSDTRCRECYQYHEALKAKIHELYAERESWIREMDAMKNSHCYKVEQKEREIRGLEEMLQYSHIENTTMREVNERDIHGMQEMFSDIFCAFLLIYSIKWVEVKSTSLVYRFTPSVIAKADVINETVK